MQGWIVGQTDAQIDRQMDGWTDRPLSDKDEQAQDLNIQVEGWTLGLTDPQIHN
jgi:hypothetical protein